MEPAFRARVEPRLGAAIVCVVVLACLRVARAQTDAGVEPVHVSYAAPAECPVEQDFFDAVRARTARVRHARDDEAARTFSVTVVRRDAGYRATLEIVDAAGASNRREVDGADCPEVVSAVALVGALSVDPAAATGASTAVTAPSGATPPSPLTTPLPNAASRRPAPAETAVIVEPAPAALAAPPVRYRWSVGAAAEARAVVVSDIALGGGIHADLAPTTGTFLPSFRLTVHALTTRVEPSAITARLTWWLARADVCPLRLGGAPLLVEACGVLDVGGLTTSGDGVDRPSHGTRAWGAAGLAPRLRWVATPAVEVFFESVLEFPFRSYTLTYVASTGQTMDLIEMLPVSVDLVLGAAYRFP